MKIAIISDIHGNLEALTATLEDIEKRNTNWKSPCAHFIFVDLRKPAGQACPAGR